MKLGREHNLARTHLAVGIAAFAVGSCMAVMQALSRADLPLPLRSPQLYYLSVTGHGVLMALVFTTFFIMGLGYLFARTSLGRLVSERCAWISFWVALIGTLVTAGAIQSGGEQGHPQGGAPTDRWRRLRDLPNPGP